MKKIAIITMGVKLNGEKGYTRFRYLAEFLTAAGYQVDLITTTFQHWEKAQRNLNEIKKENYPFGLKFIYEPGYKRNVDLRRVRSHRIAAENLKKLLETEGDYDLLYAEIPPNDVALAAAEFAKTKGIPFVADVNDLWPEAMRMVLDIPVVSDILFHPLLRDAEKVYSLVSGVVGTSDEYRDRPFARQNRDIPRITVYVGNEISQFDAGAAQKKPEVQKGEGEFWVGYAGTIGTSYDIETMVLAGEELARRGRDNIRIKILGGGPTKEKLEELARQKHIDNVEFVGYAPYDMMAAYLTSCDVLVNSFVKKAPQSIVTKIGDYLAAGKPMINTCSSPEFRAKVDADGFGVNIEAEDAKILADAILKFADNPKLCKNMGQKARQIAEEQFDRPKSYQRIQELIEKLTEK
jgi:glycosyltransferase involved in cell wall biosynthesis